MSQFCENALKEAIEKLKNPKTMTNGGTDRFSLSTGSLFGKRESVVAGPTGIEPATYGLRVRRSSLTEPRARLTENKLA